MTKNKIQIKSGLSGGEGVKSGFSQITSYGFIKSPILPFSIVSVQIVFVS